jgi:hypothetical protein
MAISDDGMSSSESIGFGSQIGDSFKGILAGIVLFPLSIYCIFKVETCTQAGDAFKNAKPVTQMEEGKPVYITGKLTATPLGSTFIKEGNYISISQKSEVYAWDEEERTEGTGSNKKNVKECKLEWVSSPKNPNTFSLPGCKNKKFHQKNFKDQEVRATGGKISQDGKDYSVDLSEVNFTSAVKSQKPAPDDIILNGYTLGENYLYEMEKCATNPEEGCERVNLSVTPIPEGDMTFLGALSGNNLVKYAYKDSQFLNASVGNYESTMQAIKSDDSTMKWIARGLCFIIMWASFVLMAGPLTTLIEFIPFVGEYGSGAIKFVFGVIAFIITAITIILVKFWYIWLLLILGGIGYSIYKRQNAPKTA